MKLENFLTEIRKIIREEISIALDDRKSELSGVELKETLLRSLKALHRNSDGKSKINGSANAKKVGINISEIRESMSRSGSKRKPAPRQNAEKRSGSVVMNILEQTKEEMRNGTSQLLMLDTESEYMDALPVNMPQNMRDDYNYIEDGGYSSDDNQQYYAHSSIDDDYEAPDSLTEALTRDYSQLVQSPTFTKNFRK